MIDDENWQDGRGAPVASGQRHATPAATAPPGPMAERAFLAASLACLLAAYVVMLARRSPLIIQDFPNHLARAFVMADLIFHHGAVFGRSFDYHFLFVPYVLGDLALASLIEVCNVMDAAVLWTLLVFLSLPIALLAYLRALRVVPERRSLVLILSLYLATDRFFMMGLLNFRLGISCLLGALALIESLRRRWSALRYAFLVVVTIVAYLIHLAPVVFLATAILATAAVRLYCRTTRIDREILLLLPVVALLAWHFLVAAGYRLPQDQMPEQFFWGTPSGKLTGLGWDAYRLALPYDRLLVILAAGGVFLATGAARWSRRTLLGPAALESWALPSAFLAIYVLMPSRYAEASFVDVRACSALAIFLIVGFARVAQPRSTTSMAVWAGGCVVVLVALFNLVYLGRRLNPDETWLSQYRALLTVIPLHGRVLPINTLPSQGGVEPLLHAGSFIVIDRAGFIPSLFSGDNGDPMKYFRYRQHPYAPDEAWYHPQVPAAAAVDWSEVASHYQYLVVTKPFDPRRIRVATRTVAENEVAAVLSVP